MDQQCFRRALLRRKTGMKQGGVRRDLAQGKPLSCLCPGAGLVHAPCASASRSKHLPGRVQGKAKALGD